MMKQSTFRIADLGNFGKLVRERRMEMGLTIEQLSEQTDVSEAEISNIELSKKVPKLDTVLHICGVCNISLGELDKLIIRGESSYV